MQLPPLDSLNYLDFALGGILLLFALRGFWRGFISELTGLIAFIAGILMAANSQLHGYSFRFLHRLLGEASWADLLSYLLVFGVGFALVCYVGRMIKLGVSQGGFGLPGRLGGLAAGLAKGFVACTLLLVFMQYANLGAQMRMHSVLVPVINSAWQGVDRLTGGAQKIPDLSGNPLELDNLRRLISPRR